MVYLTFQPKQLKLEKYQKQQLELFNFCYYALLQI